MLNPGLTNPQAFARAVTQLADSCHKVESWQTQFRVWPCTSIPTIDVLVSSIFRSQPNSTFGSGATLHEGNSTGLSANHATLVPGQTVNLLEPGVQLSPDRINQLDARFGKLLQLRPVTERRSRWTS